MLEIIIPEQEYIKDPTTLEIGYTKATKLRFEHSLISISKWEMKWHKSYFSDYEKATPKEAFDYLKCMLLDPIPDDEVLNRLTQADVKRIKEYIEDPMTATTFTERDDGTNLRKRKRLTNEVIYSNMEILGMNAAHYEKWHINRLLTLIRVISIEQTPPKKGSRAKTMEHYMALNNARRKALGTKG